MNSIKQSNNRNRLSSGFRCRITLDQLKKPNVAYCNVPHNLDEEFGRTNFNFCADDQSLPFNRYYFCYICGQHKDFETSLAIFPKCFHDFCSNCYFKNAKDSTPFMCHVCNNNVGKVLVTDRPYKPSIRLRLLEQLTTTPGSNVCSLVKNFEQKIESQNLLFCPFKLNGCEEKLTLQLPLSADFDPYEIHDFSLHLIYNHNMFICGLCIVRNQFSPIHVAFYNEQEFINHMKSIHVNPNVTNSSPGIDEYRHAVCPFCDSNLWFVDQTSLLEHCKQSHLECDFCHKVYAATLANMMKHYRKDHKVHTYCKHCRKPFTLEGYVNHVKEAFNNAG